MGIKYFVFQTKLLNQIRFIGRIILKESFDQEKLVGRMLEMGTSMTKTDIMAVLNLFMTAVERVCMEGNKINMNDFLQFTPVIGGLFEGRNDGFVQGRNSVYLTAQVSRSFNQRIGQNASVEKMALDENRPLFLEVIDSASNSDSLVMGHIIGVYGRRLKLDPALAGEYLHLVNADNPTEFVAITQFHKRSDQELIFLLPTVTFSRGFFELVSGLNTSTLRKGVSEVYQVEAP